MMGKSFANSDFLLLFTVLHSAVATNLILKGRGYPMVGVDVPRNFFSQPLELLKQPS